MDTKDKYMLVIDSLNEISSELYNSENGLSFDETDAMGDRVSSLISYISELMASDPRT